MQPGIRCALLIVATVLAVTMFTVTAAPYADQQNYWNTLEEEDPLLEVIAKIGSIVHPEFQNNKRGLDLGLSRGFSGSQAAKHMMGLAAANHPAGPGRRRRYADRA